MTKSEKRMWLTNIENAGDAVVDGVDDAIDAVDPDADTNNGGKTNTGR